jgi:hypothetical protein
MQNAPRYKSNNAINSEYFLRKNLQISCEMRRCCPKLELFHIPDTRDFDSTRRTTKPKKDEVMLFGL